MSYYPQLRENIMGRRTSRLLKSEQLESRRPLAADLAALDVNDDMSITALDALIIIDRLNQQASGTTHTAEAESAMDCDTNSDGVVSPVDVLNVVNQINSGEVIVPETPIDTTTSEIVDTPETNSQDDSELVPTPDDEVPDTSPNDSTDETDGDDSDSTDSSDPQDPVDDTDSTDDDEDLVTDPTDDSDDGSADDDSDDANSDPTDDSTDDDTDDDTDEDSGTDNGCEHGDDIREVVRRGELIGRTLLGANLFDRLDTNDDGMLTSDEVPSAWWDRLVLADADDSQSVTAAELDAYREAQRVAAVEAFFEQLDRDDSGAITSSDVSRLTWRFLSRADANDDGAITIDELLAVRLPGHLRGIR